MVFRFIIIAFLLALLANSVLSQPTLISVGPSKISTEEFLFVYNKNKYYQDTLPPAQSIERYVDLFVNFKLKVLEAYQLGMDQTDGYQQEIAHYRKQLAERYLTDTQLTEALIQEAYQRMLFEVDASHLLIKVPDGDTSTAMRKVEELRNRIIAGEDFNQIAFDESQDPSVQSNGGRLGYFGVFRTVYPFETAAYNTNINEVSQPVITNFGIHLIKVHDRRPSRGRVKVSQIMIRKDQDSVQSYRMVGEVYKGIGEGESWEALCRQYSDDSRTKNQAGRLPWFGTGQMFPAFEEAAFGLDTVGQISQPVAAAYGWHIIKLDQKNPVGSFEESREWLESMIQRDSRSRIPNLKFIARLKQENNWVQYKNVDSILATLGNQPSAASDLLSNDSEVDTLFTIHTTAYTTSGFAQYLNRNQPSRTNPDFYEIYENFENTMILEYEEQNLEEKYPEFRMLYREYQEGILLFDLMQKEVWGKALLDSAGLQKYYQDHQDQYLSKERAEVLIFTASEEASLNRAWQIVEGVWTNDTSQLAASALPVVELEKLIKQKYSLEVSLKEDTFEAGSEPFPLESPWKVGAYHFSGNGDYNLVLVRKIEPERVWNLQEVKGSVISDYQDFIESRWVSELRAKYPVSVNKKELKSLIKQLEN